MKSIREYFKFREYASAVAYTVATGKPAPAFRPEMPVKRWFDPAALANPRATFRYDAVELVDGKFKVIEISMSGYEAATVNIPASGTDPAVGEWPVPLNPLPEGAWIEPSGNPMGDPVVKTEEDLALQPGVFTVEDQRKLDAIYRAIVTKG